MAGLGGRAEIAAWRVWGGQRALATGASGLGPPVGAFLCLAGVGSGRTGGDSVVCPTAAQSWRGRVPGPHGERPGDTCSVSPRGGGQRKVCSALRRAGRPRSRRPWGPVLRGTPWLPEVTCGRSSCPGRAWGRDAAQLPGRGLQAFCPEAAAATQPGPGPVLRLGTEVGFARALPSPQWRPAGQVAPGRHSSADGGVCRRSATGGRWPGRRGRAPADRPSLCVQSGPGTARPMLGRALCLLHLRPPLSVAMSVWGHSCDPRDPKGGVTWRRPGGRQVGVSPPALAFSLLRG